MAIAQIEATLDKTIRLEVTDELDALLEVLPPGVAKALHELDRRADLLEVVLDLGRLPEARFVHKETILTSQEVTPADIDCVVSRLGPFTTDNRAGIERTLHRISAIRNRQGDIVGLTCRVGRAVYGTVDIIRDIVESRKNVLLLGRPGVGKTTMLREVARILAEKKRVIVVDTSNEIAGDGDIPHPGIGRARRMQVPTPSLQHAVMIEAVENHMPEVIIIDEIGTELEAAAARTIAERGVQLVGTAHGNSLDNLMMNPTLADLVGGIQTVTLSDEEARRRGTQKSILERKAPPTFQVVVEIQDWDHLVVRYDVAADVDAILRGQSLPPEIRYRDEDGQVQVQRASPELGRIGEEKPGLELAQRRENRLRTLNIHPYGVSRNRLAQAIEGLHVPAVIGSELAQADVVLTLKNYYRRRAKVLHLAEERGIPIYVLRSNTITQMENCLADIFSLQPQVNSFDAAMQEAQEAIEKVLAGARMAELSPRTSYIRRRQHQLTRQANLLSSSIGRDPHRRVRIYHQSGHARS